MDSSQNSNLGGFNANTGASFGTVNSAANMGGSDIVSTPSTPPKKRFGKIIAVVVGLVILVGGVIAAMAIIKSQAPSKEEIYSALWNFYYRASYKVLVEENGYLIGEDQFLQRGDNTSLFPFLERAGIERVGDELESTKLAYEELKKINPRKLSSDEQKSFNSVIGDVGNTLAVMEHNYNIIINFYDAFIAPLNSLYNDGEIVSCVKTEEITALLDDITTNDAAEIYFSVYCKAIEAYYEADKSDVLENEALALVDKALESLNNSLDGVDNTSESKIKSLLKELMEGLLR